MKLRIFLIPAALVFLLASGCKSDRQDKSGTDNLILEDTLLWDLSEIDPDLFLMPPADLMVFINEMTLKQGLTNPVENQSKYVDVQSKCLNLGVYIADMMYLGILDDKLLLSKYLKQVKQMTTSLQIYDVFTEELLDRLRDNLHKPDSLFMLSGMLQENFVAALDGNNRQNILALVSIGVFVESLFLTVSNLEDYQDFNEINTEMMNQKLIFEQYHQYASYLLNDPKVSKTLKEIDPLKNFFDELTTSDNPQTIEHDSAHHFIVRGGDNLVLTPEDYRQLNKTLSVIRTEITNN